MGEFAQGFIGYFNTVAMGAKAAEAVWVLGILGAVVILLAVAVRIIMGRW